ncbi:MAG: TrmH family RNA methyltransferase, partial [bacterium]|nr:TrmH family RNA methyltransferase [bacterium]
GWEKKIRITPLLRTLKSRGYKIVAIEQSRSSIPYYDSKISNLKSKIALVVGNETHGLPRSVLKCSDKILEIPMRGRKESLNVAVAFGIVVFHLIHNS